MLNFLAPAAKRPVPRTFASTLRHLGALGLFFLAILDSSPLPTFGGPDILTAVLSASHRDPWYEYAATATAGSVLGAYFTFRVARHAGSAYLDKKFKKSKLAKFLKLFKRWGSGTLFASTAIPIPTPTSMFFAAAGASDYPRGSSSPSSPLAVLSAIPPSPSSPTAMAATSCACSATPCSIGGWLLLLVLLTLALIAVGILVSHRLETASA